MRAPVVSSSSDSSRPKLSCFLSVFISALSKTELVAVAGGSLGSRGGAAPCLRAAKDEAFPEAQISLMPGFRLRTDNLKKSPKKPQKKAMSLGMYMPKKQKRCSVKFLNNFSKLIESG